MTDELEDRPKADDDVKVPAEGEDKPTADPATPAEDPEAETAAGSEPTDA